jgi:ADP-ribosylglycohydrolase
MTSRRQRTINSSLWATYGDALGFISELADSNLLFKRTGTKAIYKLTDWERKIGGLYGPIVQLPSGAYSDDTQLRLSTSRAINSKNRFDINAFSKIELPIWSCYALGAGVGSKLAANSLSKKSSAWYNNFYTTNKANYISSGGNGAAMRIQPHVWSSALPENSDTFIIDVIKNSLTTHGHPRAIAGAVFHALCLSYVMTNERIPDLSNARFFLEKITEIPALINNNINLRTAWIPLFESKSNTTVEESYSKVSEELTDLINKLENLQKHQDVTYSHISESLDLKNKEIRGSATLTSIAALGAALLIKKDLNLLLLDIVNDLGSDTDSIATMTGALRGYLEITPPPQRVQDQDYIAYDAMRLYELSQGNECDSFNYPNLENWGTPASTLDYVYLEKGIIKIIGIGEVSTISKEFRSRNTDSYNYSFQWVKSKFGQSFLVKIRDEYKENLVFRNSQNEIVDQVNLDLHEEKANETESYNLDSLTTDAIKSNFDAKIIGEHILMLSSSSGINEVVAYSAIISKAIISRTRRKN